MFLLMIIKTVQDDTEPCTAIHVIVYRGFMLLILPPLAQILYNSYTTPLHLMNNKHTVKVYLGTWPATSSPLQAATAQPFDAQVKSILVSRDLLLVRALPLARALILCRWKVAHKTMLQHYSIGFSFISGM